MRWPPATRARRRCDARTASSHLSLLVGADLIEVENTARTAIIATHDQVAHVGGYHADRSERRGYAPTQGYRAARRRNTQGPDLLRSLAGGSIVLTGRLIEVGAIELDNEAGLVTPKGEAYLRERGIMIDNPVGSGLKTSRPLCRPCLDWSEQRFHIAGKLGAAICTHFFEQGYLRRVKTRARS